MNNIDDILDRLQSAKQPALDCPEELTDRIMDSLDSPPALPVREGAECLGGCTLSFSKVTTPSLTGRTGGESYILPLIRTALSLAAMWIIGFFIYLQFDVAVPVAQESQSSQKDTGSGSSTLKKVYKDRLCQDCKKTIRYTQIRSKLYENK